MAICTNCGKRVFLLKLNARGLCEECANKARARVPSGQIAIGCDGIRSNKGLESIGHEAEEKACKFFIENLAARGFDKEKFTIEHRAQDYTSLVYSELSDFLRIKITNSVKWLSIALCEEDREKYYNSPLFTAQKNKNQIHWKSYFDNEEDIERYLDLAANAPRDIFYGTRQTLTEKEKEVAEYLRCMFIECGADADDFYLYILKSEFELLYHSQFGSIRVKVFSRKKGGYIIDSRISEYGFEDNDGRLSFSDISELSLLKDQYIPQKIKDGLNDRYSNDMKHYIKYEQ